MGRGGRNPIAEPIVQPEQPAGRCAVSITFDTAIADIADPGERHGASVEYPQLSTAMLNADGHVMTCRDQVIEHVGVEIAGYRLVVADGPDPAAGWRPAGFPEHVDETAA